MNSSTNAMPDQDIRRHAPSYYAATSHATPDAAPLAGEARADVCIIGGGYSGLSAALHLARAGVRVVLVEQALLGWGASGRNGGQIHVGMRRGQDWLERQVGREDAMALWTLAQDGRDHVDWLIETLDIDCDFRPGYLHVDHKRAYVDHSRRMVDLLRDRYDYPHIRFVDEAEVRQRVGSDGYYGGTLDARGGHLHPLNFALGIARGARAAGAVLHERTPVTGVVRQGSGWRVEAAGGHVLADKVVLACNGYLRGLAPEVEARVMPINNFVGVTEPLGAERAASLIRGTEAVSDSRFVVYYFRITPDHRLLFGGGESYGYRFPADIKATVRPHILKVYPQLADVRLDYAWGGTLSVTPNRLPFVRQIGPGFYNISGYSGLGVVLAPYFGKLVAGAIAGDSRGFDQLARLPVPQFPGGRLLRWPTLVAAMSFFALKDRL